MTVEQMKDSGELSQELGATRRCFYKWRAKLDPVEPGLEAPQSNSHESSFRMRVHHLKRLLTGSPYVGFTYGAFEFAFFLLVSRPHKPFSPLLQPFNPQFCSSLSRAQEGGDDPGVAATMKYS